MAQRIGNESTWAGYCRAIAEGYSGVQASSAKLCLSIGGETTGAARQRCADAARRGEITAEQYVIRMDAIDEIERMRAQGMACHAVRTPISDWRDLGHGCHQRRTHLGNH